MKLNIFGWLGLKPNTTGNQYDHSLHARVNEAHREWQEAQSYFQTVSDPELVDHAIYCMEAAQRKYLYLFRQLRNSRNGQTTHGGQL